MKKIRLKFLSLFLMLSIFVVYSCEDKTDDPKPDVDVEMYKIGSTEYHINDENKIVTIRDFGDGVGNKTLSSDSTWILDGFVFVAEGQTLNIEPGTMIQGKPGQGENASALIVMPNAKIIAEGTAELPIVFTGEGDTYDGQQYMKEVQGLWGGIIILGNATTNNSIRKRIEGVPEKFEAYYGGENDNDNSGILKYVSIRHGGTDIGAGNEINGLTLGAVGSSTIFDYIEIISNVDDGVEFFGGAPQLKHIIVAYCGDDSYDYDEGFHGKGQFWVALQRDGAGDRLGEHDGGSGDDEEAKPYATPIIANATYIGNGGKSIFFRDNAGGDYVNSIFVNAGGLNIEYRNDKHNSYDMLNENYLKIRNNIFSSIAEYPDGCINIKEEKGEKPANAEDFLIDVFNNNNNVINDIGISIDNIIPNINDVNGYVNINDTWFDDVNYQGAFNPNEANWAKGWTLTYK